MAEEIKEDELTEPLSCDIAEFRKQINNRDRIAVIFAGQSFPATESFIDTIARAQEDGYLGNTEIGVIPVDSQECDNLAESEKVDTLPTVNVYAKGKKIGSVSPTDKDAKEQYKETISKLIDLSED